MRILSTSHNGSLPGCAMHNKAGLCSAQYDGLRKPLRNVVIESGSIVENVVIAECVFSCSEKWICWPRTNVTSQTWTCFSAEKRGISRGCLMQSPDFIPPPSLPLCRLQPRFHSAGWRIAASRLTCRRTCFHWITQCSSLDWVFISPLCI